MAWPDLDLVNAVAPGWIETASSSLSELVAGRNTPAGRTGSPDEVAATIAWLASEAASYITGQIIVDRGNAIQEYKGRRTPITELSTRSRPRPEALRQAREQP